MKKTKIIFFIIAIIFIITGSIGVAFAIKQDLSKYNYDQPLTLTEPLKKAKKLNLHIETTSPISIIRADDDELKLIQEVYTDQNKVTWDFQESGDNANVTIKYNDKRKQNQFFVVVDVSEFLHSELVLFVPNSITDVNVTTLNSSVSLNSFELEHLGLDSKSGYIEIDDVKTADFTYKSTSGYIDAENVSIKNNLTGHSTSGSVDFEHISAEQIDVSTTSGEISINDYTGKIKASSTSGNIYLQPQSTVEEITAKATSGGIELSVPRNATNFAVKTKTNSGYVSLLDDDNKMQCKKGNGKNIVSLETTSGSIRVDADDDDYEYEDWGND